MDPITVGLLASLFVLITLDVLAPARKFPRVRGWRARGVVFLVASVALSMMLPLAWDPWLSQLQLVDASGLGVVGGSIVGILVYELALYGWHRMMHRVPFLWRIHQMHHSAERVDVFGAYYFHPLDVAGFALMGSLVLVAGIGLDPLAAAFVNGFATFCALFQHSNIRTPRWVGYFVQRPESHGVHHERGVHAHNYSDLPLWDIVFGTFRNPAKWEGVGGYWDGASDRIGAMLLGQDVTTRETADEGERAEADRPSIA